MKTLFIFISKLNSITKSYSCCRIRYTWSTNLCFSRVWWNSITNFNLCIIVISPFWPIFMFVSSTWFSSLIKSIPFSVSFKSPRFICFIFILWVSYIIICTYMILRVPSLISWSIWVIMKTIIIPFIVIAVNIKESDKLPSNYEVLSVKEFNIKNRHVILLKKN